MLKTGCVLLLFTFFGYVTEFKEHVLFRKPSFIMIAIAPSSNEKIISKRRIVFLRYAMAVMNHHVCPVENW